MHLAMYVHQKYLLVVLHQEFLGNFTVRVDASFISLLSDMCIVLA